MKFISPIRIGHDAEMANKTYLWDGAGSDETVNKSKGKVYATDAFVGH